MKTVYLTAQLKASINAAIYALKSLVANAQNELDKQPDMLHGTAKVLVEASIQDHKAHIAYLEALVKEEE